ncbi:MAG: pseudouridine-5'-phosphate glycosidase [Candidatus Marinimicrobia bacterium]|jgi:pseudouridylate synthase|nr:pseudouridine-5'-phosphate glycosidase [Candidatus Neomarinimicrobiota bacterium]MBT4360316.1 pseudouridine-5'-phosphate glycosidase [Candidatus Neomarinimicrobiota bacterium]MBT4715822.1 pseudouridine-5'-phosphate glycosidase [Candidatus Neomarinimicrobiota bacterium]MBT4945844.1 pseudouridine-5'-phosphate glycosidase [Candidatus Neomarinimicrobiota bacterium]MBT5270459.1 pseudouridine-5'-phosphate glycosidase [Candidatus Neomarinimicrobiota bacterium]
MKNGIIYTADVLKALNTGKPVVALESTIIAHGMPYPQNLEFAREAEAIAIAYGAEPATIAILGGKVCVGLDDGQLEQLASDPSVSKVATREIGFTLARKGNGATTVSATMSLAQAAGIKVFATGGIGGVHRGAAENFDISADLIELSRTPVIVVSAGAKAILDLPKTLEYLETMSVPVIGYQTDEFPAFYSRKSGLMLSARANFAKKIAATYLAQLEMGISSGILVANPVPEEFDIPLEIMDKHIADALQEAHSKGIEGKALTPFMLGRIVELTGGESLVTNRALALNNVKLAAEIAFKLSELT